ncbi:SusC/RagA family TonB-linked outer membrane protein [Chitinophaga sp. ysch24]|uniref:SusC/RagA family TonB-linked outer membrane protein n=2 Tax=Chitinophaga tropicalis TaxID=2683588 RepID=A0A7K1UD88_9BACT|nr:SusC/RagA family TonB-linked outer membrane protein [Chitinophaga tropicalis]
MKNAPVEKVLQEALKDQPVDFSIEDKTIIISRRLPPVRVVPADTTIFNISGKVTDTAGNPLPGATVLVKGTKQGAITNADGQYSINSVSRDAVFIFNFVGYKPVEIQSTGRSRLDVQLAPNLQALSDVVVVGYGSQKKENLTGAIATVSAKELESRPLVNLAQGLQGIVPNLNINLNNGKPGTGANFNIRGITSINSGNSFLGGPLVMVDGVQMDPNMINPGDVETVTVLKDAASSAIYGSRGAYGVILITTKSGKRNSPMRVNYAGSYTITRATRLPKYLNSVDYIAMHREADRTGQLSGGSTASFPFTEQDSIMAARYFEDPANNPSGYPDPGNPSKYRYVGNTDWVDVLYSGWRPQQQHNVSVSGGSEKTSFIGSMGYFNQKGTLNYSNEDFQRINPSLKISTEATSWLSLNLRTSLNRTVSDAPNAPTNGNSNSYIQGDSRPNMPVFNPGGKDYSGQGSWTNPVAVMAQNGRNKFAENDLWFTGGAVITPVKNVKLNADYTYNNYTGFQQQVQKQFAEYGVDHVFLNYYPWTYPDATTEISYNNNYNALNLFASYENTFKGSHYFKLIAGYNQEYRHIKKVTATAKNLIDPGTPSIGLNDDLKPFAGSDEFEWALNGLLYRMNYIFRNKYLLEVDGRYDGTSSFPRGRRFVWSPSASAGWRISEEGFFLPFKTTINDLKLRASYGQLPNQLFNPASPSDASVYPYIALSSTGKSNYIFGSQQSIYVGAPGLVSQSFTWEEVVTKDVGVDVSLLNQRLDGSFDWYIRDTKNMLVGSQPLPAILGVTPPLKNAANLRTKGWELSLTWKDKIGKDFGYSVRLALSDYSSTITRYDLNPNKLFGPGNYYVGQKFGEIWGFETDGYFKTDAEAAAYDQSQLTGVTQLAGDIKYKDLNKDGKISYGDNTVSNPGDQKVIGNSTPRYQYGVNLTAQYRNFDMTVFVQGVAKRDIMPSDNAFFGFYSEWSVPFEYMKDHWTPENTNAYFPRLRFGGGSNFQTQTKYLQNAGYCRLKNISLGYTLPASILSRAKITGLRVYVTGQNLFELTGLFKAYDPEIIGFGTYPLSRAVSFGVQLGL